MRHAKRNTTRNDSEELQEAWNGHFRGTLSTFLQPYLLNQHNARHIREKLERTGRRVYFLRHCGFDVA